MFIQPFFFLFFSLTAREIANSVTGYRNKQCFSQTFQQQIREMEVSMTKGLVRLMPKELKGYKMLKHHCI